MTVLIDRFERVFSYLRLSVTDRCNFRCSYCLPQGYCAHLSAPKLSGEEIESLIKLLIPLGLRKVRLTGGEPTLRKDFFEIIDRIRSVDDRLLISITTNGHSLLRDRVKFIKAGLSSINISLDTLHSEKYESITGFDKLKTIQSGIEALLESGFREIKLNTVLLKGINDDEVLDFVAYSKNLSVDIRFIELMNAGIDVDYFTTHFLSSDFIKESLLSSGWKQKAQKEYGGPAKNFGHDDYLGQVGIISAYGSDFCTTCNRLRIDSHGNLYPCLLGDIKVPIREYLKMENSEEIFREVLQDTLNRKRQRHRLIENQSGHTCGLSIIGG